MTTQSHYRHAMLGLAAGDAVGTTVEFKLPGSFVPLDDLVGGGPFRLRPGEWTDDTSMALCLAASLVELERYGRWWREGYLSSNGRCFDIGGTVSSALRQFEATGEPYCGSTDPKTAGNGSIMRLAPVPLVYARHPVEAVARSAESSRTTHGAATAVDACRYLGALLVCALGGASKDELLASRYEPVDGLWRDDPLHPEVDEIAAGSFRRRRRPEIVGSGFVVRSLEAALWAFWTTDDFRQGCLATANLGNDADMTAAVYGQLAGAAYGAEAIPKDWRTRLASRQTIESLADGLLGVAERL